jgi:putative peptidoglycan lipid II flippase
MARSLFRASILVSLALLLSRLSGLVREQVLGARLGLSAEMDGALLLLTLPDLMVGLLLSGGFTAALVPVLTRAEQPDRIALARRMMLVTGLGAIALGLLLFVAMPLVLGLLAPSLDLMELTAFQAGFALSLVAIPISAAIGVSSAYLHVKGSYSTPALTVLAFNGLLIVYFFFGLDGQVLNFAVFGLAVMLAALLRFALQAARMPEAFRRTENRGSTPRFGADFSSNFVKGILGAALIVGMPLIFRSLYALGGDGELARFNYALRLFELPMGILIGPITVIFLPLLSHLHASDRTLFQSRAALGLRAAYLLGLTGTLTVLLFAQPITGLLFGFGEMRGDGAAAIAAATRMIILGLPFMAAFQILSTALNASNRTADVLRYSGIAFSASVCLAFALFFLQVRPALAAEIGFIAFGVLACALGFRAVFHGAEAVDLIVQLGLITLRAGAVTVPFVFLTHSDGTSPPGLTDLLLMAGLSLAILGVNFPVMRDLARIRDTRHDAA